MKNCVNELESPMFCELDVWIGMSASRGNSFIGKRPNVCLDMYNKIHELLTVAFSELTCVRLASLFLPFRLPPTEIEHTE